MKAVSYTMTKKEFLNAVSNGKVDILQAFINIMSRLNIDYCVIGGLAINAYAEPVVSLELDIVVAADNIETLVKAAEVHFSIQKFTGSVTSAQTNPT